MIRSSSIDKMAGRADKVAPDFAALERGENNSPVDVKAIREGSGLTQTEFARTYGFTLGALRDWEQGRKRPERTAQVLLRMVAEMPDLVARAVAKS